MLVFHFLVCKLFAFQSILLDYIAFVAQFSYKKFSCIEKKQESFVQV